MARNSARDYPGVACEIYRRRRDVLCDLRFALVENEQWIAQAVRGIRRALPELAPTTAGT